jgi:hydroxymethylglutaryl-CoA reductase (NADPH)
MPQPSHHAREILSRILGDDDMAALKDRIKRRLPADEGLPPRLVGGTDHTAQGVQRRLSVLRTQGITCDALAGIGADPSPESLAGNIENYVGTARLPVGIVGPIRINGTRALGDFYIPMATTEGALIASYQRGAQLINQAGGCAATCLTEAVLRAPCFVFDCLAESAQFLAELLPRLDELRNVVASTSRHCRLMDFRPCLLGKELYLILEFFPGDASGQNMVTLATEAVCQAIVSSARIQPRHWYVEGNLSGDKKATMLAFTTARGKKTLAECVISAELVRRYLHASPQDMARYWQVSVLGGIQSGSIGVHGHFANALTAMFIACGQDVACVSEASVGVTRLDLTEQGELYASVSLPNLIVGTVGGGTHLPTARECLAMMGCVGEGTAAKFAEICAAVVLAGELSIIGSMAAGDFAHAHASYGRRKSE